jgi:subtilisin family serine protease
MPSAKTPPTTNRVLVKLRPEGIARGLQAVGSRSRLRPLHETSGAAIDAARLGLVSEPQWFLAQIEDGEAPWDGAHAGLADQLGVAPSDIVFAEPDLVHDIYQDPTPPPASPQRLAAGEQCRADPQDGSKGKAVGDRNGWHLGDDFSQLAAARDSVTFSDPRTRIGHLDTGYLRTHITRPRQLRQDLERNFVAGDHNPDDAQDPDNKVFLLDNSGHGTGTLSILAGGQVPDLGNIDMGGAPEAEVVPLRIADTVVLLHTSSFAQALRYAVDHGCDVVSMSMGGLPSQAWREEVDRAYLAGVCIATAAGNNFGGLPTRHVVYPARYARVIAVCGVMANGKPYTHLQSMDMEGNYGPRKVMRHALGAYSPNIPWALYPCPNVVRWNGGGTSSATPQVAAAAALWFEKYKAELPRDWRRVEAVRKALFSTAASHSPSNDPDEQLGQGVLRAAKALAMRPDLSLEQTKSDGDSFAFLRVITGLGLVDQPARERMFNLEIAQRWLVNPELQRLVPDPDAVTELPEPALKRFMEAVIEDKNASAALRKHVAARYPVLTGVSVKVAPAKDAAAPKPQPVCEEAPELRDPARRRLRVYALDPSLSTQLSTAAVNEVTLGIRWEALRPGPSGEYLVVRDQVAGVGPSQVNLDDPRLLAQDGWAPSEGNPQFHQQMVYGVAMKTIEHFEQALGRPVLWRHGPGARRSDDGVYRRQLEIRPHALNQANAFYSPSEIALLFGYFDAGAGSPGDQAPGSRVYTCLSHDIIAHETTHAILDGMYRRYNEPTNPEVLAFHEAFADIVALLQHFTLPQLLEAEIARTRGDVEAESLLGSLAVQFAKASLGRGALRDAIGRVENGSWKRIQPDPSELQRRLTPHARGAILVAAVFDAFISIYKARSQDLLRIATMGTGVLPTGTIHPDLVRRLAEEAAKAAGHVLTMCIRALDYTPPVDVTFFEYLRALITADFDLVADDRHNYRVALVEAFRRRGIQPLDSDALSRPRTLSVDTLRWRGVDVSSVSRRAQTAVSSQYSAVVDRLRHYAELCVYVRDREALFTRARAERRRLHNDLKRAFAAVPAFATGLGLDPGLPFEVHELRPAMRVSPDGRYTPQVVLALTQSRLVGASPREGVPEFLFRGGSTLVVDLAESTVRYGIVKNFGSQTRLARTAQFVRDAASDPLRKLLMTPNRREPFAALHALAEEGV